MKTATSNSFTKPRRRYHKPCLRTEPLAGPVAGQCPPSNPGCGWNPDPDG